MKALTKWRRHWLTGVLEEVPVEQGPTRIVYETPPGGTIRRVGSAWDSSKDFTSRGMSLAPEQATPTRIAELNENARRHRTGAIYDKQGVCHLPSRKGRAREMKARGDVGFRYIDNDAGYGDFAGN